MTTTTMHREALRRRGREAKLQDLRDGRRERSTRIESAKAYRRRPKHQHRSED